VLLRLLPLHELASGAMAPISRQARDTFQGHGTAVAQAVAAQAYDEDGASWARRLPARMSGDAADTSGAQAGRAAEPNAEHTPEPAVRAGFDAGPAAGSDTGDAPIPAAARPDVPVSGDGDGRVVSPDGPGVGAEPGAPSTGAEPASANGRPPLGGIWLDEDGTWPTLTLGGEQAKQAWPDERPGAGLPDDAVDGDQTEPPETGEDHDPRPEGQDPGDGPL
jgi:hypothetical protein